MGCFLAANVFDSTWLELDDMYTSMLDVLCVNYAM